MLRTYDSLFDHFIDIEEYDIAKKMGVSLQSVVLGLKKLNELEVLSYLPQTDTPQIQFLQPRIDTANLQVDHTYIRERKEIMEKQIEAVFSYLEDENCRSKTLLNYFDDFDSQNCGVCDNCLRVKNKNKKPDIDLEIQAGILNILSGGPKGLNEIILEINLGEEKRRIEILRQLLDLEKIKKINDHYSLP
jgi:ATP-dependent DNA helicase RecQ